MIPLFRDWSGEALAYSATTYSAFSKTEQGSEAGQIEFILYSAADPHNTLLPG